MAPRIYVTKTGKRYFVISDRKVYINANMTKREISSIYKLLQKSVPRKKSGITNKAVSSARAIVNINNAPPRRRRRKNDKKSNPSQSTIDEKNRVTVSGAPKDSGDKDLLNKQTNEINRLTE